MTAKEYLSQLEVLHLKIEHKRKRAIELRELALKSGNFNYSEDYIKTSANEGKLERDVTRYIDIETEIEEDIYEYQQKKDLLIGEIHTLDNINHIKILYKRYIEFKSLKKAAAEMQYDYSYIRHIHRAALQSFERKHTITHFNVL